MMQKSHGLLMMQHSHGLLMTCIPCHDSNDVHPSRVVTRRHGIRNGIMQDPSGQVDDGGVCFRVGGATARAGGAAAVTARVGGGGGGARVAGLGNSQVDEVGVFFGLGGLGGARAGAGLGVDKITMMAVSVLFQERELPRTVRPARTKFADSKRTLLGAPHLLACDRVLDVCGFEKFPQGEPVFPVHAAAMIPCTLGTRYVDVGMIRFKMRL
jgi:hypothetical protein